MGIEKDRTSRLYENVAGRARFRLAVELSARGRGDEAIEVISRARRVSVTHPDLEMSEALEELRSLLREFDASSRWAFGCLLVIEVLRDLFASIEESIDMPALPVLSTRQVLELLEELAGPPRARLKALEEAFGELCRERLGLEPDTARAIQPPWVQVRYSQHRSGIEAASVEPDGLESARASLLWGWGPEGTGMGSRPGEG